MEIEKLIVTLRYYEQQIRIELPIDYIKFTNCLCTMLSIPKEGIKNFKIFYNNCSNNKQYLIENSITYTLFLNAVKNNYSNEINIELFSGNNNQNEINNNRDYNSFKEDLNKDEDDLVNPYKESFHKNEEEILNQNNINILKGNENMQFSFLDEKKLNKDNNVNIINNNISYNNKIDNNNNSYHEQNNLEDNQKKVPIIPMNFNIKCNFCNKNVVLTLYFCKDCFKFFCSDCEISLGKNHQHCYYKIRNKKQFKEIFDLNNINNKINNFNNNINNGTMENKLNDFFEEGSKVLENTINSVVNFFNRNFIEDNNTNNIRNPYNYNENNISNPYGNFNNNQNLQINNNTNNQMNNINNNKIKLLIQQTKSQYNLPNISDNDIEKALIESKGNIDQAVVLVLSNKRL